MSDNTVVKGNDVLMLCQRLRRWPNCFNMSCLLGGRPPSSGVALLDDLQNALDQIKSKNSSVINAGDFNCGDIDWPLSLVKPGASE